jgi:hypothetical protein
MNAQGPQYHGTSKKTGEEDRFRTNVAAQTPLPTRGSMYSKPLPGGRSLEPRKVNSPGTPAHNFKVTKVDGGFRVANGTIRGETPMTSTATVISWLASIVRRMKSSLAAPRPF